MIGSDIMRTCTWSKNVVEWTNLHRATEELPVYVSSLDLHLTIDVRMVIKRTLFTLSTVVFFSVVVWSFHCLSFVLRLHITSLMSWNCLYDKRDDFNFPIVNISADSMILWQSLFHNSNIQMWILNNSNDHLDKFNSRAQIFHHLTFYYYITSIMPSVHQLQNSHLS